MSNRFGWLVSLAVIALVGCASPGQVPFEIGEREFPAGDDIVIEGVSSMLEALVQGTQITVRGTYQLSSRDSATLYLGTTTTTKAGGAYGVDDANTATVERGTGRFELRHTIPAKGYPHLTFYDSDTGAPFGGVYFGQGAGVLARKNWSYAR